MTIDELVESTGLTQTAFAEKYNIPLRTIQSWIGGQRKPAEYIIELLAKVIENEKKEA